MSYKFSVIIPLYNKRAEIADTLRSALMQSYPPHEIVVVDDGSTDGGGDVVRQVIGELKAAQQADEEAVAETTAESGVRPAVRLIVQSNAGECAARNRGMAEATGQWFALLDADDRWEPGYLTTIASLIDRYPGCGAYCTSFVIASRHGLTPGNTPAGEGIVEDYFRVAIRHFILTASTATIAREAVATVGGFPEGMRLGGDQYMWTKLVTSGCRVACSPQRMCRINIAASNRSVAIYVAEKSSCSFRDFWREGDFWRNEYLAKCEINKAITISSKGGDDYARSVERFYRYTSLSRRAWRKLWTLNRLPIRLRRLTLSLYNRAAWLLASKGL
ncbi:hypothetical protein FACS1894159_04400 [Bacteroidia bacterium]|nr:hypothetical protein FACS1894159_04400 [Bacteroidia bacterium]